MSRLLQRAAFTVVVALAGACSDGPTATSPLSGSYILARYGGNPLPVVIRRITSIPVGGGRTTTCDFQLASMTLDITDKGLATRSELYRTVCDDNSPATITTVSARGSVVSEPSGLSIDFDSHGSVDSEHFAVHLQGGDVYVDKRDVYSLPTPGLTPQLTTDSTQLVFSAAFLTL